MARELDLDLNQEPINPGRLRVYTLSSFPGRRGDPPNECLHFDDVQARSPVKDEDAKATYSVEIEYDPSRGGRSLGLLSVIRYLRTFEDAKVTEEAMAQTIRTHLMNVLNVDDIFVHVRRERDGGVKQIRLGKP